MTKALVYQDGETMILAKDEWPFPATATFVCENGHKGSPMALCLICKSNSWFVEKPESDCGCQPDKHAIN
jgi:hypothetical protein